MSAYPDPLFPCTIVGSYPQPDWLIDRGSSAWRVPPPFLAEAQNDATRVAVQDQLAAGLDIVTDGEIRRESGAHCLAGALKGVDAGNRIVAPIKRTRAIFAQDVRFLRGLTGRKIKCTIPGPFTFARQAKNDFYASERECALAYADAVNAEIHDLFANGADVVQLDEQHFEDRPDSAAEYGLEALNRALEGVRGTTCVHIRAAYSFLPQLVRAPVAQVSVEAAHSDLDCAILRKLPDADILLGVLDSRDARVESVEIVKKRVRRALRHVSAERLILAPDCGMKNLSREAAFGKLLAMCQAARELRREFSALHKRTRRPSAATH